jgi:hypothetical protein
LAVTTTACAAAGSGAELRMAAAAAEKIMCRAFTETSLERLPHRQR